MGQCSVDAYYHDYSYLGGGEVDEAGQVLPLWGGQILLLLEPPLQLVNLRYQHE